MNKKNVLRLANAIEAAELASRGIGFNMALIEGDASDSGLTDLSGHNCGTVCCIAGYAQKLFNASSASEALGIDGNGPLARDLFMPVGYSATPKSFTVPRAVSMLRNFAATGNVEWEKFDRKGSLKKRVAA